MTATPGHRRAAAPPPTGEPAGLRVRAAIVSLLVGIVLLAVKYVAYLHTGSAAILSDALESIINVAAAIVAVISLRFASRPPDRGHPYGHGKIEYFSAAFEGGLIAFAALAIVWYAVRDLVRGAEVAELELGLLLTVGAGRRERRARLVPAAHGAQAPLDHAHRRRPARAGRLQDQRRRRRRPRCSCKLTGIAWFDPLAALVVGVNLAATGYRAGARGRGRAARRGGRRPARAARAPRSRPSAVPGIIRIHRLRAIRSGRETHADAHVIVPEYWTRRAGARRRRRLRAPRVRAAHDRRRDRLPPRPLHAGAVRELRRCRTVRCAGEPFSSRVALTLDEVTTADVLPRSSHGGRDPARCRR